MPDNPKPVVKSPVDIIGDQVFLEFPAFDFTIDQAREAVVAVLKTMSKNGWVIHQPAAGDVDPARFHCPFCNHERPRMAFSFQATDIGGLATPGHVEYFVISCFECKRILTTALLSFIPPQMPPGAGSSLKI